MKTLIRNIYRRLYKEHRIMFYNGTGKLESYRMDIFDFGSDPIELNVKIYE